MATVVVETRKSVGYITLNRPDKLNSMNREMALEMQQALDRFATDEHVRAIYITGAGKGFCAGQDLAEVAGDAADSVRKILSEQLNPIVSRLRAIEKPVVAAVNGVAAGAGANIALCCDIVVANESATFIQAFSKIGLIPDSGGTYVLPRLIGMQRASALLMLGDKVSAKEALEIGMIYRLFPAAEFESGSVSLAETLAGMPTRALALVKQALNRSMSNTFAEQLACEDELQAIAGATYDFSEGVKAFIEKRPPKFEGR